MTASIDERLDWRLAALAVGQVISWGILYYALIVAAPAIADDTGWPLVAITLAFSAGLIASALAGIPVGRWLDERSPRALMTCGAVLGTAGLGIVAAAPNLAVFTTGWILAGLGQSAVLYQAAFTIIARRYATRRRTAMTLLTLAGGLASTVFAPIVAGLLMVTDWRATFAILAAVLFLTTTPLHWWTVERAWPTRPDPRHDEPPATVAAVLRSRRFWMLETSMVLLAAAVYAVTLAVIPLFTEKGLTFELAAWALGLLGAGQVVGRLIYVAIPHAAAPWIPIAATAALSAAALAALALIPGPPWLLIVVGILAGAVRGAQTLVQGSAVADRWGTRNYGAINGTFAAPITIVAALGPALGPALAGVTDSYALMALFAAVVALLAAGIARGS